MLSPTPKESTMSTPTPEDGTISTPTPEDNGVTRPVLTPYQLFYLSFLRLYVSTSWTSIATRFNRRFGLDRRVTPAECHETYLNLHDDEHQCWTRAKGMNRNEPHLLRTMMQGLGLPRRRWDVEIILPVGPVAMCRPVGQSCGRTGGRRSSRRG